MTNYSFSFRSATGLIQKQSNTDTGFFSGYFGFSLSGPFHQCFHTLNLYVALTRRTDGRRLGTYPKQRSFGKQEISLRKNIGSIFKLPIAFKNTEYSRMNPLRDNVYLRVLHMLHVRHVAQSDSTYRQVPSISPCLNAALLAECTWIRPRLPRLHSFIKDRPSWYRNPTVRPHTSHCALRTVKRSSLPQHNGTAWLLACVA